MVPVGLSVDFGCKEVMGRRFALAHPTVAYSRLLAQVFRHLVLVG